MIQLSDHFTTKKLLQFTYPSIVMMVFMSIYGVVDGFFVLNFVGKTPFAAVNFAMPILMILGCFGFMFGTGGSALISKKLGEGNNRKANELFSMLIIVSLILGLIIAIIGFIFIRPILSLLGANGDMLDNGVLYSRVIIPALPVCFLQYAFQSLFVTAEKPKLGLYVTVAAGITNMVLDALFVGVFKWGLIGAASATAFSQLIGGALPVLYFWRSNSILKLTKPVFDAKALIKICTNGSSEVMNSISMSLVGMLYNVQLLKYAGENGISAYGVLMYVNMIFITVFIGFSIGTAPIIGFNYGAKNSIELKNILRKSIFIISISSVFMFISALLLAKPLTKLFVGFDSELMAMTLRAFSIYSFCFLFCGFAIYGSSFFTALNDGLTSAIISFMRTLVFQTAAILSFPLIWGLDGIWISTVAAEILSVLVTLFFITSKSKVYKY